MSDIPVSVTCNLQMVASMEDFYRHIAANRKLCRGPEDVINQNSHVGKRVAIVGAGPSFLISQAELLEQCYDEVWGCNRGLNYLIDNGLPATHGFAIDQGVEMLLPREWRRVFPVHYLLASSVHPRLAKHIARRGAKITWFHNYLGIENPKDWVDPPGWQKPTPNCGKEMYIYQSTWPATVQVGYGLNSVPRAICLALWMGFAEIDVYGADCACIPDAPAMPSRQSEAFKDWLGQVFLYPGVSVLETYGPDAVVVEHELGAHRWHTRPDLLISAKHLVDLARSFPDKVHLKGDTLPAAMLPMPQEYFDAMPHLKDGGVVGFNAHPDDIQRAQAAVS